MYEFKDFSSFALISVDSVPKILRFQSKKRFSPIIDIPITSDVNPVELRNWLKEILPEDENARFTTTDALIDIAKI